MDFKEWLLQAERRRFYLGTLVVPAVFLSLPCGCERKKIPQQTRRGWKPDRDFVLIREVQPGVGIFWKHAGCGKRVCSNLFALAVPRFEATPQPKERCYFV